MTGVDKGSVGRSTFVGDLRPEFSPYYMCGAPNRSLLQTGPILENCEQLELFALTRFTVFLAYFSGLPV